MSEVVPTPSGSRYLLDLVERALATYVQTLFGLLIASGLSFDQVTDLSFWQKALLSGLPALLSVLKSGLARFVGSPDTAALLPRTADTPLPTTTASDDGVGY